MIATLNNVQWLGDRVSAVLDADGVWQSPEAVLADYLNLRYSPLLPEWSSPAMGRTGWAAAQAAARDVGGELVLPEVEEDGVERIY